MTSSPLPFTTHDGCSALITHPYWSSTPFSDLRITTNIWKKDDPLSLCKLAGEGHLSKPLGHQDLLSNSITKNIKETAWVQDIRASLSLTNINTDKLLFLIGKINHSAHIITPVRNFQNQLCNLLKRGNKWGLQLLQSYHRQDLHLWIKILQWVTEKEVPIENIVFTTSTVKIWYDAWKYGIGSYNDKCMAWQLYIPLEWYGVLTLNLL